MAADPWTLNFQGIVKTHTGIVKIWRNGNALCLRSRRENPYGLSDASNEVGVSLLGHTCNSSIYCAHVNNGRAILSVFVPALHAALVIFRIFDPFSSPLCVFARNLHLFSVSLSRTEAGGLAGGFQDGEPEITLEPKFATAYRDDADGEVDMVSVPATDDHVGFARHGGVNGVLGQA